MKKLIFAISAILLGLFLTACNSCNPTPPPVGDNMDYIYKYETGIYETTKEVTVLPTINTELTVVEQLAPNVFVVDCKYSVAEPVAINAISLVINYDSSLVTFNDTIQINDNFYETDYNIGGSPCNNTGSQIRFAFYTVNENIVDNGYVVRFIVSVNGPTNLSFSTVPGELEFNNMDSQIYPLQYQNILFLDNE